MEGIKIIDWKKQDKCVFRNFDEAVDHHDIVKALLMRMLRRKHPNRRKVSIYSEFAMSDRGIGDVWMKDEHSDIYVYEIQKDINKHWIKSIHERYQDVNLIIVPLKKMPKTFERLRKKLEEYVV